MSKAVKAKKAAEPAARPTLRDVAKHAGGVHPSTVSLAMRNHPGISEALRKKIKTAARELGYRPDPLLDAFNTHRVSVQPHRAISTLAWIVEASQKKEIYDDPFGAGLLTGALKAAEFFHCQLEIFCMGGGQLSPARLNTVLKTRGIVGLVCVDLDPTRPPMELEWDAFCPIRIESGHLPAPFLGVAADHKQEMQLAVSKLKDSGALRIGFASSKRVNTAVANQHRIAWTFEQYREAKGQYPDVFQVGDSTPFETRRWAKQQGLDALIVNDHRSVFEVERGEMRDVSGLKIACLDAARAPAWVSGTVVDTGALGAQAVEQAVTLMRSNQRGNPDCTTTTYLPVTWRQHP